MTKKIFNLRNVFAIAICLAGMLMFNACSDDDKDNNGNSGFSAGEKEVLRNGLIEMYAEDESSVTSFLDYINMEYNTDLPSTQAPNTWSDADWEKYYLAVKQHKDKYPDSSIPGETERDLVDTEIVAELSGFFNKTEGSMSNVLAIEFIPSNAEAKNGTFTFGPAGSNSFYDGKQTGTYIYGNDRILELTFDDTSYGADGKTYIGKASKKDENTIILSGFEGNLNGSYTKKTTGGGTEPDDDVPGTNIASAYRGEYDHNTIYGGENQSSPFSFTLTENKLTVTNTTTEIIGNLATGSEHDITYVVYIGTWAYLYSGNTKVGLVYRDIDERRFYIGASEELKGLATSMNMLGAGIDISDITISQDHSALSSL
jgi:hypothetical protein